MDNEIMVFLQASIERNEREAKEALMRKKQEKILQLLEKSGLGERFMKRTFDTFDKNNLTPELAYAYDKANEFVKKFPDVDKGLLFTGPVGTGKTHLAAAIANELINKLYSVVFGNVTDIVTLIKSTYKADSELSEAEIIKMFTQDTDLLIIDDLGKENISEYTSTILYQIINRLYENEKPVIVTTNFNSAALRRKFGEKGDAIVSRLAEMCEFIKIVGSDWRLKNARSD
jgi:DNA replication protein DnaC